MNRHMKVHFKLWRLINRDFPPTPNRDFPALKVLAGIGDFDSFRLNITVINEDIKIYYTCS